MCDYESANFISQFTTLNPVERIYSAPKTLTSNAQQSTRVIKEFLVVNVKETRYRNMNLEKVFWALCIVG